MLIKGPSFYPVPRVDSQGLRLDLLPDRKTPPRLFYPLVRSLFASRRKTIQNNLFNFAASVIIKKNKIEDKETLVNETLVKKTLVKETLVKETLVKETLVSEALQRSGISGSRRAETLETWDFVNLANILEEILDRV
jgi:16S rRNA (adenine1518-N6/adenine1519-N6)-dimethyltransferase